MEKVKSDRYNLGHRFSKVAIAHCTLPVLPASLVIYMYEDLTFWQHHPNYPGQKKHVD